MYKAGDRVRITQNTSGHEHAIGLVVVLTSTHGDKSWRTKGSTTWILEEDWIF